MANLVRVTGRVGLVDEQHVVSKQERTFGQSFTFHTATIMVANAGVAELRFDPARNGRTFAVGDEVDLLAAADVFGNRPTLEYRAEYPADLRVAEAESVLTAAE